MRTRIRQPGKVGSPTSTIASSGSPSDGERALEEAVVGGIAHRREQPPVERDPAELLVPLVLVARARGNLDEHDVGHVPSLEATSADLERDGDVRGHVLRAGLDRRRARLRRGRRLPDRLRRGVGLLGHGVDGPDGESTRLGECVRLGARVGDGLLERVAVERVAVGDVEASVPGRCSRRRRRQRRRGPRRRDRRLGADRVLRGVAGDGSRGRRSADRARPPGSAGRSRRPSSARRSLAASPGRSPRARRPRWPRAC